MRNIPNKASALLEMARVVIPNGLVMVLELPVPSRGMWGSTYSFYLNIILPKFARLFTQSPAAYHYLSGSVMNFSEPKSFLTLMESTGLRECQSSSFTFGVCTLYTGKKSNTYD